MKDFFKDLMVLYSLFFKIGLFSIGGGYVMLPMLRLELVEKRKWVNDRELLDYYAIGQATPGIIAVNTATFVGYTRRGIPGAFASTAGMVSPSLIIILAIAIFIPMMETMPLFQKAFRGIRVAVSVLLVSTLISLTKKGWKSWIDGLLTLAAFSAVVLLGASPFPVILAAGFLGLLLRRHRSGLQ
ncbi:chromate transporter [Marispirochaeta aestuarii]|uniref:chromate transporter n=1 Tax=Marispirochaeta aestuarii TaxID=1963862 RepID=UPI0029C64947|nr:chromate transporter [Marispirochaeta aestuarii]